MRAALSPARAGQHQAGVRGVLQPGAQAGTGTSLPLLSWGSRLAAGAGRPGSAGRAAGRCPSEPPGVGTWLGDEKLGVPGRPSPAGLKLFAPRRLAVLHLRAGSQPAPRCWAVLGLGCHWAWRRVPGRGVSHTCVRVWAPFWLRHVPVFGSVLPFCLYADRLSPRHRLGLASSPGKQAWGASGCRKDRGHLSAVLFPWSSLAFGVPFATRLRLLSLSCPHPWPCVPSPVMSPSSALGCSLGVQAVPDVPCCHAGGCCKSAGAGRGHCAIAGSIASPLCPGAWVSLARSAAPRLLLALARAALGQARHVFGCAEPGEPFKLKWKWLSGRRGCFLIKAVFIISKCAGWDESKRALGSLPQATWPDTWVPALPWLVAGSWFCFLLGISRWTFALWKEESVDGIWFECNLQPDCPMYDTYSDLCG